MYAAKGFLGMLSKFVATVLLSIVVLIGVTLFVSLGGALVDRLWHPKRPDRGDLRRGSGPYGPRRELVRTIGERSGDDD